MSKAEDLFEAEITKERLSYEEKLMQDAPQVLFTAEAEKMRQVYAQERRVATPPKKASYELLTTVSLAEAVHFARDNGWKDKKVQVKAFRMNADEMEYTVEPFEKDCNCPNLLRYEDYIDGGKETD
jgi:hypothetical protein